MKPLPYTNYTNGKNLIDSSIDDQNDDYVENPTDDENQIDTSIDDQNDD